MDFYAQGQTDEFMGNVSMHGKCCVFLRFDQDPCPV